MKPPIAKRLSCGLLMLLATACSERQDDTPQAFAASTPADRVDAVLTGQTAQAIIWDDPGITAENNDTGTDTTEATAEADSDCD